jgi:hypothetical protein
MHGVRLLKLHNGRRSAKENEISSHELMHTASAGVAAAVDDRSRV